MDYTVHGDSYEHCDSKLEHGTCGLLFQGNYPVASKVHIYIYELVRHNAGNSVLFRMIFHTRMATK